MIMVAKTADINALHILIPIVIQTPIYILLWFLFNEYIIIDNKGISCVKKGITCWSYPWNAIYELQIVRMYTNPCVQIIPKSDYQNSDLCEIDHLNFQLCPKAKKALRIYNKCPITSAYYKRLAKSFR